MRDWFYKIIHSRHFEPILNITCIWLTGLAAILNISHGNTDLGIVWAICCYLNGIKFYFNNDRKDF